MINKNDDGDLVGVDSLRITAGLLGEVIILN